MGAFNLALSIKHFNPNIHITLVSDNEHQSHYHPEHYKVFNSIKTISPCHHIDHNGTFQPGIAKINICKYSSYKKSLYIDADSLVLQDLKPLFDRLDGSEFKSNVIKGYTQWTDDKSFKEFFGMDFSTTINSSWFYWEDNKVFEQAQHYYAKGFPIENINPKWGYNTYPDELFFNAAIQRTGTDPKVDFEVMFFGNVIDKRTNDQIEKDFYAFTLYGGQKTVRLPYIEWYDRLCFKFCSALKIEHRFKSGEIVKNKHVQNR